MPAHVDDSSDDEFEFSGPSAQPSAAATGARPAASASNPPIARTGTHLSLPRKEMNQPFDEAVELSASSVESAVSADNGSPLHAKGSRTSAANVRGAEAGKVLDADESDEDDEEEADEEDEHVANARPSATSISAAAAARSSPKASPKAAAASLALALGKPAAKVSESEGEDEEEEESDDEQGAAVSPSNTVVEPHSHHRCVVALAH